jgi:hypothetical protein
MCYYYSEKIHGADPGATSVHCIEFIIIVSCIHQATILCTEYSHARHVPRSLDEVKAQTSEPRCGFKAKKQPKK